MSRILSASRSAVAKSSSGVDYAKRGAAGLARSAVSTTTGHGKTSPGELNRRLAICKSCEHWRAGIRPLGGHCGICGCSTPAKLRISAERCPIGDPKYGVDGEPRWIEEGKDQTGQITAGVVAAVRRNARD